jgi:hypothetical protein
MSTGTPSHVTGSGIDIRQALDILSQRSSEPAKEENSSIPSCGCHQNVHKDAHQWGQRIDIGGGDTDVTKESEMETDVAKVQMERAERRVQIEECFSSMSVKDLIGCVISSQRERVATYRTYDS